MTTPGNDLIAFIKARLDEDEAAVHEASQAPWCCEDNFVENRDGGAIARFEMKANARFAAWFDPERARREVRAGRSILALHGWMSILPGHPMFNDAHLTREPMRLCRSCEPETMFRREQSWPCRTLRALAAIWDDHPGWRAEWAPDAGY